MTRRSGILFKEGEANPMLERLWESIPDEPGEQIITEERVDPMELLPALHEYFEYNGSLTTPPCSEGVIWVVLKQPIHASREQIQRYLDIMGTVTNGPVQPHNARMILE